MHQTEEWFSPDVLGRINRWLLSGFLVVFLGIPAAVFAFVTEEWFVPAGLGGLFLVTLGASWWWAGVHARTVRYRFGEDAVESRGGVWWQTQSTVPYARITNVEAKQGPIARHFGVGSVAIQTAGKGAQSTAEVTIKATADYQSLRDQLLESVREVDDHGKTERSEPPTVTDTDNELLGEVRRIRELLEGERAD